MHQLNTFLNAFGVLEPAIISSVTAIATEHKYEKGATLLSTQQRCNSLYFIKSGLVKMQSNTNGNEFIMRFFHEGMLFTNLESLNKNQFSRYEIIALETTEIVSISYEKFNTLCEKHHALETFYRKFLTLANLNMMERIKEMLEEDAKARYANFVKAYPSILQRISLGDLSKYLGITQVSLSRIRASY